MSFEPELEAEYRATIARLRAGGRAAAAAHLEAVLQHVKPSDPAQEALYSAIAAAAAREAAKAIRAGGGDPFDVLTGAAEIARHMAASATELEPHAALNSIVAALQAVPPPNDNDPSNQDQSHGDL